MNERLKNKVLEVAEAQCLEMPRGFVFVDTPNAPYWEYKGFVIHRKKTFEPGGNVWYISRPGCAINVCYTSLRQATLWMDRYISNLGLKPTEPVNEEVSPEDRINDLENMVAYMLGVLISQGVMQGDKRVKEFLLGGK